MRRSWLWQRLDEPGLEHFVVDETMESIVLDGALVASIEGAPVRLHYAVKCDAYFAVRSVDLTCEGSETRRLLLRRDKQGRWTDGHGAELPALAGCDDIDIAATPATNTLPIRRLRLEEGESAEVPAVYVAVPSLDLSVDRQRYTLVQRVANEAVYRFESRDAAPGFVAEVMVDAERFVVDYEGLFRRL